MKISERKNTTPTPVHPLPHPAPPRSSEQGRGCPPGATEGGGVGLDERPGPDCPHAPGAHAAERRRQRAEGARPKRSEALGQEVAMACCPLGCTLRVLPLPKSSATSLWPGQMPPARVLGTQLGLAWAMEGPGRSASQGHPMRVPWTLGVPQTHTVTPTLFPGPAETAPPLPAPWREPQEEAPGM